jgi:peptidoglycan/LPS O-acetylase OafA/YrhL
MTTKSAANHVNEVSLTTGRKSMSSNRYAFLDGIRGLAAMLVLIRHTSTFWEFAFFRSYLAVDLFFILSGFVVASAYERKLKEGALSVQEFFLIRLIRMYPMYFFSFLFCLVEMGVLIATSQSSDARPVSSLAVLLLTAVMLPSRAPTLMSLYPMNGPYWSLFFELMVNFIYAALRPLLSNRRLFLVAIFFGAIVAAAALRHGSLDIGFEWGVTSVVAGFSRAAFGIFVGVLIFRKLDVLATRFRRCIYPWLVLFMVGAILMSPSLGRLDGVVDLLVVILVFPIFIIVASQGMKSRAEKWLIALGGASYPMYVLHHPVGQILSLMTHGAERSIAPVSGVLLLVFLIAFSLAIEKVVDLPVRRWLTAKLIKQGVRTHVEDAQTAL